MMLEAQRDRASKLGAQNLVQRCLGVQRGEVVAFLTHGEDPSFAIVRDALLEAGAEVRPMALDSEPAAQLEPALSGLLSRCTASIALGAPLPMEHHNILLELIEPSKLRHVHMPTADLRVLGTSGRADPFVIERVNEHVVAELEKEPRLRCESAGGTALDVRFGAYPILSGSGRVREGYWDNVPSGVVYAHPLSVSGTFVADRGLQISGRAVDDRRVQRHPLVVELHGSRVVSHASRDPELIEWFTEFLGKHEAASRVGMIAFPTNYLARAELGHRTHDGLLPGLRLHLGWSNARFTKAPYDAPVSARLTGRRQRVSCGELRWVQGGRFCGRLEELTRLGEG